eukprot:1185937-Prorocentrum_minimum.AAC.1
MALGHGREVLTVRDHGGPIALHLPRDMRIACSPFRGWPCLVERLFDEDCTIGLGVTAMYTIPEEEVHGFDCRMEERPIRPRALSPAKHERNGPE